MANSVKANENVSNVINVVVANLTSWSRKYENVNEITGEVTNLNIKFVRVHLTEPIDAFDKDGNKIQSMYFDLRVGQFVSELVGLDIDCATLANGVKKSEDNPDKRDYVAAFGLIFANTKLEIARVLHNAGDTETKDDGTVLEYSRDCYTTSIVGVTLRDDVKAMFANARAEKLRQAIFAGL